jgi:glycosyltransferase involved in cell wall biosynthesis
MRLLSLHRYRFRKGGAEAVFLDHQQLFADAGWTCADFVMSHPENEDSKWRDYYPSFYDPAESGRSYLGRSLRFIYSSEARAMIARLLDDFRPDIVHVHGVYQQLTPSVLPVIAGRNIPIVYTAHDYKLLCPAYAMYSEQTGLCERCAQGRVLHCVWNRCLHKSRPISLVYAADAALHRCLGSYRNTISAYVMPSQFIRRKFLQYGYPDEKLHFIPNAFETTIDAADDGAGSRSATSPDGEYVLFFGRLSPEKGLPVLIEASARAGLPLVIVGRGPEEEKLRQRAAAVHAPVRFIDHTSGDALWAIVDAAMCVALPSVCFENAPKSLLEAQARGKIAVVSNIGGLPELIENGVTGFLATPGDIESLAAALSRARALSPQQRAKMGKIACRRVRDQHSRRRYYDAMSALYQSLLRRHPTPCREGTVCTSGHNQIAR